MKSIKKIAICAGLISCALPAVAQTTYSGYFVDNYTYRFQMNPAMGNDKGFVSFPVLGNINIGMHGNLNLNDLVYPLNGKTVLFTNPGIPTAEAMSRFKDVNRIGSNEKFDILSFGFKAFGGYNTFSLSAVTNFEASIPLAFFSIAKEGVTNSNYDIKNMDAYANAYGQIALNHSRYISQVPGLRVGATVKFLLGAGNLDFHFNEAELRLEQDKWVGRTNADVYASVTGLKFDHSVNDKTGNQYVSGANVDDGFGLNGWGLGFDLGADYIWNDFRFSVAALDLGFMNWGQTQWASTDGTQEINTDAYTFSADDKAPNYFKDEMDRLTDDLSKLYELKDMGELSTLKRSLATTLNFGVQYQLPYYRKLTFGLLNSTRINGRYTWTQFRLSANVTPISFLSFGINGAVGTYGTAFGWLLNIHTTGFNLFAGMDHTVGKLSKQMIPLKSNNSFNLGINFPF